ncbi:hypothetical protein IF1G_10724 [Cordyceps javanica]|uniref:BZIP domain-containing protein n=1 Tax=Cordyceps javanica TaxID=43265 RepID=A0A545UM83_9HYPO|nr:hypothetical protein IF1G_10724 [Cordyceps javanica]
MQREAQESHEAEEAADRSEGSRAQGPRVAGRPRADDSTSDSITTRRRLQLRRSQQTYRKRKEAASKGHEQRAAHLEATVCILEQMLATFEAHAVEANVDVHYPSLHAELQSMRNYLVVEKTATPTTRVPSIAPRGYQQGRYVSNDNQLAPDVAINKVKQTTGQEDLGCTLLSPHAASNPLPSLPQSAGSLAALCQVSTQMVPELPGPVTYSHNELSFSRRLQRNCIEFSLRLYADERTDPGRLYRVFRLVPCVQDKKRTLPTIHKLLRSGPGEVLEVAQQPFYRIGGAGGHYPHYDDDGNPCPLPNTRLPKRLLGIPYHVDTTSACYQEHLRVYDLDQEWFDCQDVAGYLQDMGFANAADRVLGLGPMARPQYDFDMDLFLQELIPAAIMLGRAPGFRRAAVEAAFGKARRLPQSSWTTIEPL